MSQAVWVIAHGSQDEGWVRLVDDAASGMKSSLPVVVSFLELVEGRLIADGLRQLARWGIREVVAIPLFVSSGSSHVEQIREMLGLLPKTHLSGKGPSLPHDLAITLQPPMDAHPLIQEIVLDRLAAMSQDPRQEQVVLVSHGSDQPHLAGRVSQMLADFCQAVAGAKPFVDVRTATKRPDTLRRTVEEVLLRQPAARLLVQPLFLAEGYFTRRVIPSQLKGLPYVYRAEAYLPHPNVTRWLEQMAEEGLGKKTTIKG